MCPCPRSRKDPIAEHRDPKRQWHMMCPVCLFKTPYTSDDYDRAKFDFWREHDFQNYKNFWRQENSMSTQDYKRGVEDALAPLTPTEKYNWAQKDGFIDRDDLPHLFADRRKSLLTKKVTKWVNVYQMGDKLTVAPTTFESKEGGYLGRNHTSYPTRLDGIEIGDYLDTYPIEIELPL